jgi:hypothetical protein
MATRGRAVKGAPKVGVLVAQRTQPVPTMWTLAASATAHSYAVCNCTNRSRAYGVCRDI